MKIAAFNLYRFSIPFIRPIKVGNVLLHDREGFVLSVTDVQGRTGCGEIAPLPGLDTVTLDRCRNDLSLLRKVLAEWIFDTEHFDLISSGLGLVSPPPFFTPHTLFGLESALLSLQLQSASSGIPDVINIPVNGLFVPDAEDHSTDRQIQAFLQNGMKTIKVKIGRLPADQEIRQILRLTDALENDLRLRLDGNRSLSPDLYAQYFSALGHLNVEYAEEPLKGNISLSPHGVPWPIALDESLPLYLTGRAADPAGLPENVRTIILKPGLLPGFSGMANFIASLKKRNIRTILSSSFNTGVGIAALGLLYHRTGLTSDIACGFDTLRYLQTDVLTNFPSISDGVLQIPRNLFGNMLLNTNVIVDELL